MMEASNNNILLISPAFFGYEKKIKEELEIQGWNVFFCDTRPSNTFLTKALIRLGTDFLIKKRIKEHYCRILDIVRTGDFSQILFVNPEGFNEGFFLEMRKISPETKLVLYLWDSLDNKPLVKPTIKYYDKCFTFDRFDAAKFEKFSFLPLFYCQEYKDLKLKSIREYDFAFIGTVHSQRMRVVEAFQYISKTKNMSFYYYLYIQSKIIYWMRLLTDIEFSRYKSYKFNYNSLSQDDIIGILSSSKAIIDIEHDKQKGLTMRTFEVLASGVKLITTNSDIINYDLYNPNNVYVIDRDNIEFDLTFLETPFEPYDTEVINKYNLSSWVKILTK